MTQPRVSILIPNFNNGKDSSVEGKHDLIENLMMSLYITLKDETTPFEVIIFDDGSTDDSRETLGKWAKRAWPTSGQPVIDKLIKAEHCGVLSITANKMVEASRGEILVRIDGDVIMVTDNWVSKLCKVFDNAPPSVGIIGPKQLGTDGKLHSFGDWILHPKGYHHVGENLDRHAIKHPMEVEHVMGCCYCCRREVHDDLEGYDERILRGQTVDFGLRARLKGWRCWAIPQIEFQHCHGLRAARETKADNVEGVLFTLDFFRKKWGFDRIAPDLDAVRKYYSSTPLVSNARIFGCDPEDLTDQTDTKSLTFEVSEWNQFSQNPRLQQIVKGQQKLVQMVVSALPVDERSAISKVGMIGNGAGVLGHVIASDGFEFYGVDTSKERTDLAIKCTQSAEYEESNKPEFSWQKDCQHIPLKDGSLDLVLLINVLETHPNPVALFDEAHRVLGEGDNKFLLIVVTRKPSRPELPSDPTGLYHEKELVTQVLASDGWLKCETSTLGANEPVISLFKRSNKRFKKIKNTPEMAKNLHKNVQSETVSTSY
ncbi:methyltransferase domain-containing protein [Planctomycetota bacterium]|nr:methyltransferase domain-containing protein [Planctomycetota bacterium]